MSPNIENHKPADIDTSTAAVKAEYKVGFLKVSESNELAEVKRQLAAALERAEVAEAASKRSRWCVRVADNEKSARIKAETELAVVKSEAENYRRLFASLISHGIAGPEVANTEDRVTGMVEQVVKMQSDLAAANRERERMREALSYPRYGNTALLLEEAAKMMDLIGDRPSWKSYFTPHLRRAAERIKAALAGEGKSEATGSPCSVTEAAEVAQGSGEAGGGPCGLKQRA